MKMKMIKGMWFGDSVIDTATHVSATSGNIIFTSSANRNMTVIGLTASISALSETTSCVVCVVNENEMKMKMKWKWNDEKECEWMYSEWWMGFYDLDVVNVCCVCVVWCV